jgi:ABC-type Mn2+/Zn2+ transport system ATPase subunit
VTERKGGRGKRKGDGRDVPPANPRGQNPPLPLSPSPFPLEARQLSVHFGARSALECVDARFGSGETVSLLGPNGAGKSTLLKALAGILPPSHGEVLLHGRPVRRPSPAVVYVPQRSGVDWGFPVSVLDVALLSRGLGRSRFTPLGGRDRADALAALDRVGMRALADVQIGQLSGGQQQRAFLARALLQDGEVYLLDEPFAGVDVPTQELLVSLFGRLRDAGKTIVYATHDLSQAAASSDRVMLLNRRLVAAGPPAAVMTADLLRGAFGGQAVVPVGMVLAP